MKKFIFVALCIISMNAKAQSVASENITTKGKWFFAGQTISVNGDNKVSVTKWNYVDTISGMVIKSDVFTHTDTNFNSWWDNYNGFYSLYQELAMKEGLPKGDPSTIENLFYNKAVLRKKLSLPGKK